MPTIEAETEFQGAETLSALAAAAASDIVNYTESARPKQPGGAGGPFAAYHYCYWRFCIEPRCRAHEGRRRWITIGPSPKSRHGDIQVQEFARAKHAEILESYGHYSTYTGDANYFRMTHGDLDVRQEFGQFEALLRMPGGIFEFPVDQWRQLRWHLHPLLRQYRPDAMTQQDYPCPFAECVNRTFPEAAQLSQHIAARHADKSQMMALADQIQKPMERMVDLAQAREDPALTNALMDRVLAQGDQFQQLLNMLAPVLAAQQPASATTAAARTLRRAQPSPEEEL